MPLFACLTDGKSHDITVGRQMRFAPGTIVVFDKGYVDYAWWQQMSEDRVWFVTRLKQDLKSRSWSSGRWRPAVRCAGTI